MSSIFPGLRTEALMPYHDTAGLGPQDFLEDEDEDEADDYFDSKLYSIQISD